MIATDHFSRLALSSAVALLLATGTLHAEPTAGERATADALFRDAKRLLRKKKYDEACPKLAESQRLDPQGGTLLNLAVCHARQGLTATAWVEFQEALALAKEAKRRDRIFLAEREISKLEPRLSRLTIEVPDAARVDGLEIQRGNVAVANAAWGTPVPVDPGEIEISATAPDHEPWSTKVTLAERDQKTVSVEPLTEVDKPAPKPAPRPAPPQDTGSDGGTQRIVAYAVGGVGIVALGVGSYFGIRAVSKNGQSEEHCDGALCDPRGVELNDEARSAARVANVAFAVGVVGVGVGTYLFVTAPEKRERTQRGMAISTSVGARQGSVLLSGVW